MKIILTNPTNFKGELAQIHQLLNEGLEILHVRKPQFSIENYVEFIDSIDARFHERLVIHSFHDHFLKLNFKRFHFSRDAYLKETNFEKYTDCILSTSTHSIEEFNDLNPAMNYAFLSPVFESISKVGYASKTNLLEEVRKRTNYKTKLIALGGMTEEKKHIAFENGFDGVAMMGSVWDVCTVGAY